MLDFLELFYSLKGSYSGAFVALWCACVLLAAITLYVQKKTWARNFETLAYWTLSVVMVIFAAFRPIGIARDDLVYLEIFERICPTIDCGQWLQGDRDWAWYSLIGVLKSFCADPRVMLWVGAVSLLIKFCVIFRLSQHPLMALVLFTSIFFEVLDLTAWRIAFASTLFMVGFWLLVEGKGRLGLVVTLCSGLFHKQAFSAILILPGNKLRVRYSWLMVLVITPIAMIFAGLYPDILKLTERFGASILDALSIRQDLVPYLEAKAAGGYLGWRSAPLVSYPLLILAIWLSRDVLLTNNRLYSYGSMSIICAAWFLWGIASLPDIQVRFFDFMILPVVFFAGVCKFNGWRLIGVALVSGIFVMKYNVLHPLLTGRILL